MKHTDMLARVNSLLLSPTRKANKEKNLTPLNKEKLEKIKNIHKGKRCFIIGGAPSLKLLDLTKLNDEFTFTVNKGYKLADFGLKHSTYHLIMDRQLLEDPGVLDELPVDYSDLFFLNSELNFEKPNWNKVYVEILNTNMSTFQEDITRPLMTTATVISQAIQIAYYMGFCEIYLIGVDLDFSNNPGHIYKDSVQEQERQKTLSVSGQEVMLKGMQNIVSFLESRNAKIFNASPTGNLNCMKRVKYEELFNE